MTQIIQMKSNQIDEEKIAKAAEIIKNGGTVVFPTETVYGLGANALDEDAVKKIFAAKGRPADNPLIVHISDLKQIEPLVSEIPESLNTLAKELWPGPITIIMKKSKAVPDIISAGLDTVGIRMPDNPIARALIEQAGVPIAAPSANISGSPSPTKAEHVIKDLNGRVDMIIDGGDCRIGLESTVLDISGKVPVILRPGGITPERIKAILGCVDVDRFVFQKLEDSTQKVRSPGVKYKHYAPKADAFLVEGQAEKAAKEICARAEAYIKQGKKVGILATEQTKELYKLGVVVSAGDRKKPESIAANLFKALRYFDEKAVDIIFIEAVENKGIGMAIMNRMIRAVGYNIIKVDN